MFVRIIALMAAIMLACHSGCDCYCHYYDDLIILDDPCYFIFDDE